MLLEWSLVSVYRVSGVVKERQIVGHEVYLDNKDRKIKDQSVLQSPGRIIEARVGSAIKGRTGRKGWQRASGPKGRVKEDGCRRGERKNECCVLQKQQSREVQKGGQDQGREKEVVECRERKQRQE